MVKEVVIEVDTEEEKEVGTEVDTEEVIEEEIEVDTEVKETIEKLHF